MTSLHRDRHGLATGDLPDYPKPVVASLVLALLIAAFVLGFLDKQILTLTVDDVSRALRIGDAEIGMLQGVAFSLPSVLLALPLGLLVDRRNRRNLLVASVALWSSATIGCGLSHSYGALLVWRTVVGAAEAGLPAICFSLLGDLFAPRHRVRASVIFFGASSISSALALVIGGTLLHGLGSGHTPAGTGLEAWRLAYLVLGATGVVVAGLFLGMTEPSRKEAGSSADSRVKLLPYLVEHWRTLSLFVIGAGLIGAVGVAFTAWFPVLISRAVGIDNATAGMAYGTVALPVIVTASITAPFMVRALGAREGMPRTVIVGLSISLLGFVGIPFFHSLPLALTCVGLELLGFVWMAGLQPKMVHDLVPNEYRGQLVALGTLVQLLFLAIVPTAIGAMSAGSGGNAASLRGAILWTCGPAWIVGLTCFVLLRPRYARTAQLKHGE